MDTREEQKQSFILLSKVAKEKKYAQEYLGLLARRGDIGSIRIGKRWYTTWEWFEEFLENSQKKKTESACEIKISQSAISTQPEEIIFEAPAEISVAVKRKMNEMPIQKNIAINKISINSAISPSPFVKSQTAKIRVRRTIAMPIRKTPVRKFIPVKKAQPILQDEPKLRSSSVEEKNRYAVPYQEIKFKKKSDIFSPALAMEEKAAVPVFARLAFAMSFAAILLLLAASSYFVWSGGLFAKGQVAGASDERNAGFSGITSGGEYAFANAGDKMKESLSVSRVMVQAAKEKLSQNNLVN